MLILRQYAYLLSVFGQEKIQAEIKTAFDDLAERMRDLTVEGLSRVSEERMETSSQMVEKIGTLLAMYCKSSSEVPPDDVYTNPNALLGGGRCAQLGTTYQNRTGVLLKTVAN